MPPRQRPGGRRRGSLARSHDRCRRSGDEPAGTERPPAGPTTPGSRSIVLGETVQRGRTMLPCPGSRKTAAGRARQPLGLLPYRGGRRTDERAAQVGARMGRNRGRNPEHSAPGSESLVRGVLAEQAGGSAPGPEPNARHKAITSSSEARPPTTARASPGDSRGSSENHAPPLPQRRTQTPPRCRPHPKPGRRMPSNR